MNTPFESGRRLASAAGLPLGVSIALAAGPVATAQVDLRPLAVTGRVTLNHRAFDYFDSPRINDAGQVLFWSRMVINDNSNDECAGAIQVIDGGTFIGNVGATSGPEGFKDVWFRYVATDTLGRTVAMTGMNFPPIVGTYSGSCGTLVVRGSAYWTVPGQTYYIRVGSQDSSAPAGTGLLTIRQATQPVITASTADDWIWTNRTGTLIPALQEGTPAAFDPASIYSSLSFPAFNIGGTIALTGATQSAPNQVTLASLYTSDIPGNITLVEHEALTPPPGVARWQLPVPSLNDSGRVGYTLLNGTQLRYGAASVASQTQAPGVEPGALFNFIDQPVQAPGAPVAFRATLTNPPATPANDSGLWIDRAGGAGVELLARTGDAAPGVPPPRVFASLAIEPAVNSAGAAAFWASITGTGIDATNNTGIWTTRTGLLALVARAGDPAPGISGAVFASFSRRVAINAAGDIAVLGYLAGAPITPSNNSGIWVFPASGPARLVAREGNQAGSLPPGASFALFSDPVLNDGGAVAFLARIRGAGITQANNQALFLTAPTGATTGLVRTGDAFAVSPTDSRTIREVSFGTDAHGSGLASFNNPGTAIVQLFFTDNSSALATAGVSCAADFNHSGTLDSQDFFDFLSAFFASDPRSDFNHSGAVDSRDFFDFLAAFFAGCS